MPKFTLPPLKKSKGKGAIEPYDPLLEDSWYRKVRVPINKAIMDKLKVGSTVELSISGKVVSLEAMESEFSSNKNEVELELSAVELMSEDNEFSTLADD